MVEPTAFGIMVGFLVHFGKARLRIALPSRQQQVWKSPLSERRSGYSNAWSASRSARRMRGSARLVLIYHVAGLSGVGCLDPSVCITLHLLVGHAN